MVKVKDSDYILPDGSINIETWLHDIAQKRQSSSTQLIGQACMLAQLTGKDHINFTAQSCLQQGLKMAEILLDLKADQATVAAAIVYNNVQYGDLPIDDIKEQLGEDIYNLVNGAQQMDAVHSLFQHKQHHREQSQLHIDNLRKMLLAMVQDVRVVLLKLAERTCIARAASKMDEKQRKIIAEETLQIYAPLANRLGVGQLKWELEDLSLRYLQPEAYQELAKLIAQRRVEREQYIEKTKKSLQDALITAGMENFEITGRAKHIYSIYKKMQRKDVDYSQIYDISAIRVLTENIEDCYQVLSCVHEKWQQIPEEFDDYINNPKPNGYRSLHTAVIGPDGRNVEVQIRTHTMHQESELGVAAHWKYKEGGKKQTDYEEKIAWLRQVLEWQHDLAEDGKERVSEQTNRLFEDRIYVFTPAGEIVDLPQGSTPLDFAYHIHSEIGHRCRGAKANGNMIPLTYALKTGERVEILTHRQAGPSRDWLNPHSGYLKTSRAKAKVHHWFKQQDYDRHLSEGHTTIEQELKRNGLSGLDKRINYTKIAQKLHLRNANDIFVGVSNGDVRPGQVINAIQDFLNIPKIKETEKVPEKKLATPSKANTRDDVQIHGMQGLLSYHAGCCKPVPGDSIIGFITKGRGISVHRQDCINIINNPLHERFIKASWVESTAQDYPVDLLISANERQGLVSDILSILTLEKIHLLQINTNTENEESLTKVSLSVEIRDLVSLNQLVNRLKKVPEILSIERHFVQSKSDQNEL